MSRRTFRSIAACAVLFACSSNDQRGALSTTVKGTVVIAPSDATLAPSGASPWPEAMHDARHSGQSTAIGPRSGTILWQRDLSANVTPGAVIGVDGSVIVATNAGILYALDPMTGDTRWMFDGHGGYGNDLSTSAAVLRDGTIAWPGPGGKLYGISSAGALRWTVDLGGFTLSPAVSTSGRIYVVTMPGVMSAIDVESDGTSAQVMWTVRTGGPAYGSPSITPDGTVVTSNATDVVAVTDNGAAAQVRWQRTLDAQIEVSPAAAPDGTIVAGDNGRSEFGLDQLDGHVRWKATRNDETYSSAVVTTAGRAYFGDHSATLFVVDTSTGALVRSTLTLVPKTDRSHGIWTAPAVDADGTTFYGTRSGQVFGVGPDGTQLFDLDIGGTVDSYPAIDASGTLYVGNSLGMFYAIASR